MHVCACMLLRSAVVCSNVACSSVCILCSVLLCVCCMEVQAPGHVHYCTRSMTVKACSGSQASAAAALHKTHVCVSYLQAAEKQQQCSCQPYMRMCGARDLSLHAPHCNAQMSATNIIIILTPISSDPLCMQGVAHLSEHVRFFGSKLYMFYLQHCT
jgi:hypothetical protein